jgi:hypothetical protein
VQITIPLDTEQIQLFDVIQVNVGRPHQQDWRVYEVLERSLVLSNGELAIDLFLRRLPGRVASFPFALTTESNEALLTEAGVFILTDQGAPESPSFPGGVTFDKYELVTHAGENLVTHDGDIIIGFEIGD